jgi:hypothetical protein
MPTDVVRRTMFDAAAAPENYALYAPKKSSGGAAVHSGGPAPVAPPPPPPSPRASRPLAGM